MKYLQQFGRRLLILWFVAVIALWSNGRMAAQAITGDITGTVTDPSGALIPGAVVTITNLSTKQVVRVVKSSGHGIYTAAQLAVGDYGITVTAPDFRESHVPIVTVNVGDVQTANIAMTPGAVSEVVQVTINEIQPNVENAENSSVITEDQINELALNTRNFEQMLLIQPGVSYTGPDQLSPGLIDPTGSQNKASLSVNGLQPTQLSFSFDGADTLDRVTIAQTAVTPSVDTIQHVKILRDSYGAQYGGGGSAQVITVSKAGSSDFHGDIYYFFRNQYLNANNFLNKLANPIQPRPPIRWNDFGLTIGGPLYIPGIYPRSASKTYFFFGAEMRRIEQDPTLVRDNYPTLAEANGYFPNPICMPGGTTKNTTFPAGPATYSCAATPYVANSPFPGYNYQVATIDPTAHEYLQDMMLPALALQQPNEPNTPNAVVLEQKSTTNANQILARIDQQVNNRLSLFGRYVFDPTNLQTPNGYNAGNGYPGVSTSLVPTYGEDSLFHGTFTATPKIVLDFGYSFLQSQIKVTAIGTAAQANSPHIQVQTPYPVTTGHVPIIQIDGNRWGTQGNLRNLNHTSQVFENTTQQVGPHTILYGVNYEHFFGSVNQGQNNSGLFDFSSAARPCGNNYAGICQASIFEAEFGTFLEGLPVTFTQQSVDPVANISNNLTELYAQDNWRVLPHTTLQLGLRYSMFGQPYDRSGHLGVFEPNSYNSATAPTIGTDGLICTASIPDAACSSVNPNYDPLDGVVIGGTNSPYGLAVARRSWLNFAPRVGFAWDVFKNGKTSLRGGYGVFFDQTPNQLTQGEVQGNPAYVKQPTFSSPSFSAPGAGKNVSTAPLGASGAEPNWHTPYTQSYSLDIQQQLASSTVLTLAYVGNKTLHLQGIIDVNEIPAGMFAAYQTALGASLLSLSTAAQEQTYINPLRPYKGYSSISEYSTRFFADYNGLQVNLLKSFAKARGAHISLSYTWSKAMANSSGVVNAPQDSYNLAPEWGPTDQDRRNILNASFVYELPWYKKQRKLEGKLLGGWQLSGIVNAVSGTWLTVAGTSRDPGSQGIQIPTSPATPRPDMIKNPNEGPKQRLEYFDTSAFSYVPTGVYRSGNEKRNSVLGPGYQVWNITLSRNINLPEKFRLQLRGETFNLFNHNNPSTLTTQFSNTAFGQVVLYRDNRQIQLGAKLYF